jgi:ferric-dicitrate binding protein FerR (iron transport regulator)
VEENQDYIWNLIARKFSGDATANELDELELFLIKNPMENYSMEILNDLWKSDTATNSHYAENKYKELVLRMQSMGIDKGRFTAEEEMIKSSAQPKIKKSKKWFFAIGAGLVATVAIFLLITNAAKENTIPKNGIVAEREIKTQFGSKTSKVLPDGTKVWLNSGSKLSYSGTFKGPKREVYLEGEAYFDVTKDAAHPFIVHTSAIDIRVLGTAFNVKAYNNEPTIEATLIHGLIEVTKLNKPNEPKVILKPHEKLIFDRFADKIVNEKAAQGIVNQQKIAKPVLIITQVAKNNIADSAIIETSWVYNRLSFEDEKFGDIAVKMERWFNVKITINNEKIKGYKLTGSFEDETVEEALKELQYLVSFSYKITGRNIEINKK